MVYRLINPIKSQSFFIFGARGTGKSTYIQTHFARNSILFDLLDPEIFDRLLQDSKWIEELAQEKKYEWIILDEVQRLPKLLDSVHRMIEKVGQKFILTGSSTRKLKRGGANLLAGRAFVNSLYPLTYEEMKGSFELKAALRWGTLPKLLSLSNDNEKKAYLKSYCLTYINEEIKAEQVVKNLEPFRDFLTVAAQCSGQIVNYSAVSRDVGVEVPTVKNYFQILEETYIGFYLPHFHRSVRKSQLSSPKFYFFDNGVKRALETSLDSAVTGGTYDFGSLFETFIIQEVFRLNHYYDKDFKLSFFRTKNNVEIDLILSKGKKDVLIEIKSSDRVDSFKVKKFKKHCEIFGRGKSKFYISRDPIRRQIDDITCLSWIDFLSEFKKL